MVDNEYTELLKAGYDDLQINQILKAKSNNINILSLVNPETSVNKIRLIRTQEESFLNNGCLLLNDKISNTNLKFGIHYNSSVDINLFAVALDANKKIIKDHVVFYNNISTSGIKLLHDDISGIDFLNIKLNKVHWCIDEILIFASVYKTPRTYSFFNVNDFSIIINKSNEIFYKNKVEAEDVNNKTLLLGKLYKEDNDWNGAIYKKFYNQNIEDILRKYS